MKAQAQKMVEKLQAFIQLMEEYEEATQDGPTEEDDSKAASKARKREEVSAQA
jgi:Asp-tRNA(Asn)/Glu-tRNA(Gln) amidotransferase C subunit